jgi:hypothetical protein
MPYTHSSSLFLRKAAYPEQIHGPVDHPGQNSQNMVPKGNIYSTSFILVYDTKDQIGFYSGVVIRGVL